MSIIQAKNLSKVYGKVQAVRSLSFEIPDKQVVGLLGPNGAGKTTTMRMLTTYLQPSTGTATIAGFDIIRDSKEIRKYIGYLPEVPPLYPELRVKEYLTFVAKIKKVSPETVKQRVSEVCERCNLEGVVNRVCGQLSKGYRQRVGLAQALVHDPQILILDEPTAGLDPRQIIGIRKLISELAVDKCVILSSHILSEITSTCSRILIIANGELRVEGKLDELTEGRSLEDRFMQAISVENGCELLHSGDSVSEGEGV